jgi:hypothetical protein
VNKVLLLLATAIVCSSKEPRVLKKGTNSKLLYSSGACSDSFLTAFSFLAESIL